MTSIGTLTDLNHAVEEALKPERCECTCRGLDTGCSDPTWLALSPCRHESAAFCDYCKAQAQAQNMALNAMGGCRACGDRAFLTETRWEPINRG